jgi:hypothetical protein
MTVKERRRIMEQYLIQILIRRQLGGNDGIHKIVKNEKDN